MIDHLEMFLRHGMMTKRNSLLFSSAQREMNLMTKEQVHEAIRKPDADCDGWEIHVKRLWQQRNAVRLFEVTGIDFTQMFMYDDLLLPKSRRNGMQGAALMGRIINEFND